ncbi:hypothetical protein C2I19_11270 [Chromobacterium alticapitis]|uniref:Uncharacterized protein n=1 Tax=Chromobacterium alticapitis TaxID=2073169 RepID=A0A2S5DG08_9NEIS|nr:hypothetical protein C2I19_11270 [Chromobacterium alticapitis]
MYWTPPPARRGVLLAGVFARGQTGLNAETRFCSEEYYFLMIYMDSMAGAAALCRPSVAPPCYAPSVAAPPPRPAIVPAQPAPEYLDTP